MLTLREYGHGEEFAFHEQAIEYATAQRLYSPNILRALFTLFTHDVMIVLVFVLPSRTDAKYEVDVLLHAPKAVTAVTGQ